MVLLLNFLPVKVSIIVLSFPFLYSDTENKVQGFLYARRATIFSFLFIFFLLKTKVES